MGLTPPTSYFSAVYFCGDSIEVLSPIFDFLCTGTQGPSGPKPRWWLIALCLLPRAFEEGGRGSAQLGGGGGEGLIKGGVKLAQGGPCFGCLFVENDIEGRNIGE